MTKFFYDCEFLEDGSTIDLISIGIVSVDGGSEYYAVNSDAPWKRIRSNPWLMRNVVPSLPGSRIGTPVGVPSDRPQDAEPGQEWFWQLDLTDACVKPKWVIANEVREFLLAGSDNPELWADCGDYDHVVLMQLWGDMSCKPAGLPYYTRDLRQEIDRLASPELPQQASGVHNALADARHNVVIARSLGLLT